MKILITGATAGIGLETARLLAAQGHHLLVHGRSAEKLSRLERTLAEIPGAGPIERYQADLGDMTQVEALSEAIRGAHDHLDVLINNAGVYKTRAPITPSGHDLRFVVNTLAPLLLARGLMPIMGASDRIVNLSSAAQQPVDLAALRGERRLGEFEAYAQSKLAITAWSRWLAEQRPSGPLVVAVNPGSLLATRMVKEGFGVAGNDVGIGARILVRAALDPAFGQASGRYFDNDTGRFAQPHPAALDDARTAALMATLDGLLAELTSAE